MIPKKIVGWADPHSPPEVHGSDPPHDFGDDASLEVRSGRLTLSEAVQNRVRHTRENDQSLHRDVWSGIYLLVI